MNDIELRQFLTEKLASVSPDTLNLIRQFVGHLTEQQGEITSHNYLIENALKKWNFLIENDQELDPNNPLNDNEIQVIRQFLRESNQSRPLGLAKGEFTVPDDFNQSLPEEVLDGFYPQ